MTPIPVSNILSRGLSGFAPFASKRQPVRLGQQTPSAPAGIPLQDLTMPTTSDQWAAQAWSKEEATAAYNVMSLLWTIREKIAFSAVLFKDLASDPRFLAVINASNNGPDFLRMTSATVSLSQALSLPNLMSSVRNLIDALEIRIFPKFGIGVRGYRPIFRGPNDVKPNILECSKIDTTQGKKEIIDFGDLCKTDILSDLNALQVATKSAQEIAPEIKLGDMSLGNPIPPLVVFLIQAAVIIGGILGVGYVLGNNVLLPALDKIHAIVQEFTANPAMLNAINEYRKTNPEKGAELLARYMEGQNIWQNISKTVMWTAIGVGALAVAAIIYMVTRPSGAPAAPAQPLPQARSNGDRAESRKVTRLRYAN